MDIHFHISREKCNFEGYKTKTNTTIQPIETMNITRSLFLFVFTLVLTCQAKAKEVYIDFSAQGFSNAAEVFNVTSDGVTIIFSQGTGSYPTRYYDNGKALRIYGGNYFQVSAGTAISSIKMNFASGNAPTSSNFMADCGSASPGSTTTWNGPATAVTFRNTDTSGHWKLMSITVTLITEPDVETVTSITQLRQLSDGTTVRLSLDRDNPGSIEWVDEQSGIQAYVRDNGAAVRFTDFLPDDAGWHTTTGGALIGSVIGEYHLRDGMPEFTHVSSSIADSILCLDFWQTPEPIVVSDLSTLSGVTYRADYVRVEDVTLSANGTGTYYMEKDNQKLLMTDHFDLGGDIPEDLKGRSFVVEGILGTAEDGTTSVLYYTRVSELVPMVRLDEELYTNPSTIATYIGRNVNVVVNRKMKTGMWNTLCLPFSINDFSSTVSEARVAKMTGFDATTATLDFSSVEDIEAGVPYLVYPEEDVEQISISGTTIDNTLNPTTCGDYEMIGIYHPTTLYEGDNSLLFLGEGNTLCYPNVTNDLKAFRAYFKTTTGQAANISVDGISTGIRTITAGTEDSQRVYHIDGQFVGYGTGHLPKGVYVSGSSKIIVK